ncbi:hypothetical protein [Pyrobaculum aerophilum]|uniref:hypothetical protein n=1 Tax=Pyrobaculum aerophilum TaxID=13773 RepID=UPI002FD99D77
MLVLIVLLTVLLAANQIPSGKPQFICLNAREAGLEGSPPTLAGFVVRGRGQTPVQLYTNGTVINVVGIWDANSTKPQIQNVSVLPPAIKGLICFQPGDPVPARVARGLYLEVESRGRRYGVTIINATDDPAAPPALPLEYLPRDIEVIRGRVVARREIREVGGPPAGMSRVEAVQMIQPSQSLFRDFSGSIVASFKLNYTDNHVLNLYGSGEACVRGRFILPNGTGWFTLAFTPATRADVYGGAYYLYLTIRASIYDVDTGRLLASMTLGDNGIVQIPNQPRPWFLITVDLSQWTTLTKRIELTICKPSGIYVYGRYIIDAVVYAAVPARSYAEPFALESPGRGTLVKPPTGTSQLYNGTYLAIPGFTPPPGYALGSARASVVIRTCSPSAPSSVSIYWGPLYIGAVSRIQGVDGCYYYVVTPADFRGGFDVAIRSSLYLGGALHAVYIGPFNNDVYNTGLRIDQLRIEGLYRPEMNARASRIFKDYATNWGYMTLSSFVTVYTYNPNVPIIAYGSKVDIKFSAHGLSYRTPRLIIAVQKYDGMVHCGSISFVVRAYSNGQPVTLDPDGTAGVYQQGGNSDLLWVDLLVDFISNLLDETKNAVSQSVLKVVSWVSFTIGFVQAASFVGVDRVKTQDGGVSYTISIGSLAPDAIVIDGATFSHSLPSDAPIEFRIERIQTSCAGFTHSFGDYSIYLDPMANSLSTQYIHAFRTFTCGKQEIGWPSISVCTPSIYG